MPLSAEVHTGAGSESESEDGVGTDDGEGAEEEGHGSAGARFPAARDGGVGAGRPPACCCVCMEPWICYGPHRICCIPCGHVYGRSCLERWLQHCGNKSAKCPQCGERFELEHITNLYASGDLWDGCCCIEVVEAPIARAKAQFAEENLKFCSELDDLHRKQTAALQSRLDDLYRKHTAALLSDVQQVYQKQLDHDV